MSLFPLSILGTSQLHHQLKSMNAPLSSDARGKRILIDSVDRISKLPDDVLVKILASMSTEDAVKTGVLSTRWKNVWKQVPYLHFDMLIATLNKRGPLDPLSNHVAKSITEVPLYFSVLFPLRVSNQIKCSFYLSRFPLNLD